MAAPTKLSFKEMQDRIDLLEALLSRLAVMTGQGNILAEYGVKRWQPGKEHMSMYKTG